MFGHSDNVTHSVSVTQLGIANAAALLAAAQSKLNNVRTAKISHVALAPLAEVLVGLPKLEHLFVHIVPETEGIGVCPNMDPHAFSWAPLSCLAELARGMHKLRAITLHVWCGYSYRPVFANAHDARGLLAQLRALQGTLPPIDVQGFPAHEVASVDLTGLSVQFDHSAQAGPLILYNRRWAYSPFRD